MQVGNCHIHIRETKLPPPYQIFKPSRIYIYIYMEKFRFQNHKFEKPTYDVEWIWWGQPGARRTWPQEFWKTFLTYTLPETNIAPKNGWLKY